MIRYRDARPGRHQASLTVFLAAALAFAVSAPTLAQSTPSLTEDWRATSAYTGKMMALDVADNVYVVGDTWSGGTINTRMYNPSGTLVWESTYQPGGHVAAAWIAADPAGGAYIVGRRTAGDHNHGRAFGYFILRYDVDGTLAWSDVSDGWGAAAVRVEADGAGDAFVIGSLDVGTGYQQGLIKYDRAGARQWVCSVAAPQQHGRGPKVPPPSALSVLPDGSAAAFAGTDARSHYAAVCDVNGAIVWQAFENQGTNGIEVALGPGGVTYVASAQWAKGINVEKFDGTGVSAWSNTFGKGGWVRAMTIDPSGNVLVAALARTEGWYPTWLTVKLDPAGAEVWSRPLDFGRLEDAWPGSIATDPAGDVYLTGRGPSSWNGGNKPADSKMVTLKYHADGTGQWFQASDTGAEGVRVRIGSDGSSVFAMGRDQMFTARYTQTGLSDPVPAAPTDLAAQAVAKARKSPKAHGSSVDLTWTDNATNEFYYDIERCEGAGCTDFALVGRAGPDATSWRDKKVAPGVTYAYRVRAHGFMGDSDYSNTAEVTTPAPEPPAAPSDLAAAMDGEKVALTWTDNADNELAFAIERCSGASCSDFQKIGIVHRDATTFADRWTQLSTTYSYRVRAWNRIGYSDYSNTATITPPAPPPGPPAAPSRLMAVSAGQDRIGLMWQDNANNEQGFQVERCEGEGCTTFAQIGQTLQNVRWYLDATTVRGTVYSYRVRAFNADGVSDYSNVATPWRRH